ncbi:MAG: hypothetical protein LBE84_10155, partial [Planctomycetota bacterium]|nr:hypothetical protein [Planctomycetota bacterium]
MTSDFSGNDGDEETEAPGRLEPIPAAVPVALLLGIMGSALLALAYGPLDYYSPLVYLNVILALGLGYAVSWMSVGLLRRLRLDSRGTGLILGFVSGFAAAWLAWPSYVWTLAEYDWGYYFSTLLNPSALLDVIGHLARNPVWRIGRSGRMASGHFPAMYYAIWIVEFLIISLLPPSRCFNFLENNRLCDACRRWLGETGDSAAFACPDDIAGFRTVLNAGDASVLETLGRFRAGDREEPGTWLLVKGYACPHCQHEDGYVRVFLQELKLNKKTKKLELSEKAWSGFIP